jgi:DNA-binding CsgD family transcriptional regulator
MTSAKILIIEDETAGGGRAGNTTEQKDAEQELEFLREKLRASQEALRQKDLALKVVLEQVDGQRQQVGRQIGINVDRVLMPLIARLEDGIGPEAKTHVAMLRDNLRKIASPFVSVLEMKFDSLTHREIEVCQMVKNGMTTAEVAGSLKTSIETVRNQRKSIRKKLGIANKNVNLGTFLQAMQGS